MSGRSGPGRAPAGEPGPQTPARQPAGGAADPLADATPPHSGRRHETGSPAPPPPAAPPAPRPRDDAARLDVDAWTAAALALLAEAGGMTVSIDTLARRLNVTKGSFYWHFKNRNALLHAMLDRWRRTATIELIDRLETALDHPRDRLRALLVLSTRDLHSVHIADIELSIRLWGRSDPAARAALAEIDALRLRYIAHLLMRCGLAEADARARAILAYGFLRVATTLVDPDDAAMMAQCEALLVGPGPSGPG